MAALVEGQQYGLSSHSNYFPKKTLIFVKLTDSALKSIEDYVNCRNVSGGQKPTVQFKASQGIITIPRIQASGAEGHKSFGFSLSNVEADGPQGSFECIQQVGSRSMESLGCMLYKMHIHANEDSYEKTREKMAVVEQESKKNCTKVIKASGPYVGRKVKVKRPAQPIAQPPKPSSSPPFSSVVSKPPPPPPPPPPKPMSSVNNVYVSNHYGNNSPTVHKLVMNGKQHNSDIMRKPSRERVIHLLAVRPYKKPELLARLMKDGIKDKDKKGLSHILSQVATLKDNTYHLAKFMWNEVQEDWPYYSQEELEMVKRRKAQLSSSLTENGHLSPSNSQPISPPNNQQQKRAPVDCDSQPPKKQRISHYVRSDNNHNQGSQLLQGHVMKTDSHESQAATKPDTASKDSFLNGNFHLSSDTHASSARISPMSDTRTNGDSNDSLSQSNCESSKVSQWNSCLPSEPMDSTTRHADLTQNYSPVHLMNAVDPVNNHHHHHHGSNNPVHSKGDLYKSKPQRNGGMYDFHDSQDERYATTNSKSKLNSSTHTTPVSSPDSRDSLDMKSSSSHNSSPSEANEVPDYLTKYVAISNVEQRCQYKADFKACYDEYLKLHSLIEKVAKRFSALEDKMQVIEAGGEEWNSLKNQIIQQYQYNKHDPNYRDTRRRFQYLHNKLSHIKRLVMEYDKSVAQAHAIKS